MPGRCGLISVVVGVIFYFCTKLNDSSSPYISGVHILLMIVVSTYSLRQWCSRTPYDSGVHILFTTVVSMYSLRQWYPHTPNDSGVHILLMTMVSTYSLHQWCPHTHVHKKSCDHNVALTRREHAQTLNSVLSPCECTETAGLILTMCGDCICSL